MEIKQFRYGADNFSYVVFGRGAALAIDGGAGERILEFVRRNRLGLKFVTNTHAHPDHTTGTRELAGRAGALYLDHRELSGKGRIELEDETIAVHPTPGHTADSVTFATPDALITGDTLFNGTVGNCFSGDLKGFYRSIKLLLGFSDETVVYAGHDYVRESMDFARTLEPENAEIDRYLDRYDPYHVRSTIGDERQANPYIRFNEAPIVRILREKGLPTDTEYDRWRSVMTLG